MTPARILLLLSLVSSLLAQPAFAQRETLDLLPLWPLNFDAIIRDQTFAPKERAIELQAGFTALWYRDLEVRTVYRFLDLPYSPFLYHATLRVSEPALEQRHRYPQLSGPSTNQ